MSTRFRPSSRNLMGGKFANEFFERALDAYQKDFEGTLGRKINADGYPGGHVPTSERQQLDLLRSARDQHSPMFTSSQGAQQRLQQLEAKEAQGGVQ